MGNPAAEGCSGVGRPSCKATECMFGLDRELKPKANSCAFTDELVCLNCRHFESDHNMAGDGECHKELRHDHPGRWKCPCQGFVAVQS